jgi:putative sigma-54 modulation protein
MEIRITARHFTLTDELRDHIHQKVGRLRQYYNGITDAHVILEIEKSRPLEHKGEIILSVYRQTLRARCAEVDHATVVDGCITRLRRQLLKYKHRLRSTDKDVVR